MADYGTLVLGTVEVDTTSAEGSLKSISSLTQSTAEQMAASLKSIDKSTAETASGLKNLKAATTEAAAAKKTLADEAQNADNVFKQLRQSMLAYTSPLNGMAKAAAEGATSLTTIGMAAAATAAGIGAGIYAINEFAEAAQKVSGIRQGFETLTARAGETGNAFLSKLRPATQGLVSDIDLMKATNESLILQLPLTSAQLGDVASKTTLLARAMGIDAEEALNRFIEGSARERPIMLARIGVVVKAADAYKEFQRQLGTTAPLDAQQKEIAFTQAAVEALDKAVKGLMPPPATFSQRWNENVTAIVNAKNALLDYVNVALGESETDAGIARLRQEYDSRNHVTEAVQKQTSALQDLIDKKKVEAALAIVDRGNPSDNPKTAALVGAPITGSTGGATAIAIMAATQAQLEYNDAVKLLNTDVAKAEVNSLSAAYENFAFGPVWDAIQQRQDGFAGIVNAKVDQIKAKLFEAKNELKVIQDEIANPATPPDRIVALKKEERATQATITSIEDPDAKRRDRGIRDEGHYLDQLNAARVAAEGKWSVEAQALQDQYLADKYNSEIAAAESRKQRTTDIAAARDLAINNNDRKYITERFDRDIKTDELITQSHLRNDQLSVDERLALETRLLTDKTNLAINADGLTFAQQKAMAIAYQLDIDGLNRKAIHDEEAIKIESATRMNRVLMDLEKAKQTAALQTTEPNARQPFQQGPSLQQEADMAAQRKQIRLDSLNTTLDIEENTLYQSYSKEYNDANGQYVLLTQANERYQIAKTALEKNAANERHNINAQEMNWDIQRGRQVTDATLASGEAITAALGQTFAKHKGWAEGMAVMNTSTAVMQVWATSGDEWYVKLAKSLVVGAIGLKNLNAIRSASPSGGGSIASGDAGGVSYSGGVTTPASQTVVTGNMPVTAIGTQPPASQLPTTQAPVSTTPALAPPPPSPTATPQPIVQAITITAPQPMAAPTATPAPLPQAVVNVSAPTQEPAQQPQITIAASTAAAPPQPAPVVNVPPPEPQSAPIVNVMPAAPAIAPAPAIKTAAIELPKTPQAGAPVQSPVQTKPALAPEISKPISTPQPKLESAPSVTARPVLSTPVATAVPQALIPVRQQQPEPVQIVRISPLPQSPAPQAQQTSIAHTTPAPIVHLTLNVPPTSDVRAFREFMMGPEMRRIIFEAWQREATGN